MDDSFNTKNNISTLYVVVSYAIEYNVVFDQKKILLVTVDGLGLFSIRFIKHNVGI